MFPVTWLSAFMAIAASTAMAMPAPDVQNPSITPEERFEEVAAWDEGTIETIVFHRDNIPTPEDHALAKRHGVDLDHMYKDTVFKRADGEDYTIWVAKSFSSPEDELIQPGGNITRRAGEITRRQSAQNIGIFDPSKNSDQCDGSTFNQDTGPNAPFTGGVNAIGSWAYSRNGAFWHAPYGNNHHYLLWRSLVRGGSNGGRNAVFQVFPERVNMHLGYHVGARDISDLCGDSVRRFRMTFDGKDRVRVNGQMPCGEKYWFLWGQKLKTFWRLHETDDRVN